VQLSIYPNLQPWCRQCPVNTVTYCSCFLLSLSSSAILLTEGLERGVSHASVQLQASSIAGVIHSFSSWSLHPICHRQAPVLQIHSQTPPSPVKWPVHCLLPRICCTLVSSHITHSPKLILSLNSTIFWDIMLCSPLSVNWRFGGTYRLHLQGRRISWARDHSSACFLLSCRFLARLILGPWRWRRQVPPKRRLTFNGLHGVISKKIKPVKFWFVTVFPKYSIVAACAMDLLGKLTIRPI
jgi:hypothetical protein